MIFDVTYVNCLRYVKVEMTSKEGAPEDVFPAGVRVGSHLDRHAQHHVHAERVSGVQPSHLGATTQH